MSDIFGGARLRNLKSGLNTKLIAKENEIAMLTKEIEKVNDKNGNVCYSRLEDQLASEEKTFNKLQRTKEHVHQINLSRNIREQIVYKEIEGAIDKAEKCIESLSLKADDDNFYANLNMRGNTEEKQAKAEEFAEFTRQHAQYRDLTEEKNKLKDITMDNDTEHQKTIKTLNLGVQSLQNSHKSEMTNMVKSFLSSRLVGEMERVEERKALVEESEYWRSEQIERDKIKEREKLEEDKRREVEMIRATQVREKSLLNKQQKNMDQEYRKLLCELFAAEAQSDRLRDIDAAARCAAHNMDAGIALRAHRRRQREILLREKQIRADEQEIETLRRSVLEEEEKRILLEHFPKLEPFLTPEIIRKLSLL